MRNMGYWDSPTQSQQSILQIKDCNLYVKRDPFVHNFDGINTMKFDGIDRQKNYEGDSN